MSTKQKEISSEKLNHTYVVDSATGWTSPPEAPLKTFKNRSTSHVKGNYKPVKNFEKLSIQPIHPVSLQTSINTKQQKHSMNRVYLNMPARPKLSNHIVPVQHNIRTNRRAPHVASVIANSSDIDTEYYTNSNSVKVEDSSTTLSNANSVTQLDQELDTVQLHDDVNTLFVGTRNEDMNHSDNIPLIPTQNTDANPLIKERPIYHDMEHDLHYQQQPCSTSAWSYSSKDHKMHPLHYAAAHGNKQYLAELLTSIRNASDPLLSLATPERSGLIDRDGIHVDMPDREGRTALMHAAYWSHIDCIRLLLDSGADVNMSTTDGCTILHQTAFTGNHITLSHLLQYKVTKTALPDSEGRLPLHWATYAPNTKCLKMLLSHNSRDIDATDCQEMTALIWASYMSQPDHLQMLLRHGASQDMSDSDGVTAVHWSLNGTGSVDKRDKCFKILLTLQSSSYKDLKGKTVAHYVGENGTSESLSLLLSIRPGAIEDRDRKGRTPLHWAAVCNNKSVIVSLLASGASKLIEDGDGKTPLDYARAKEMQECIELLSPDLESPTQPYDTSISTNVLPCTTDINSVIFTTEKFVLKLSDVSLLRNIGTGCYLQKYTNKGKGPKHRRYFWMNIDSGQLCWAKHGNPANSEIKTLTPVDVRASPSLAILGRRDFDASFKHQFCFCILCTDSLINLIATSSEAYSDWVYGLKAYLTLGAALASQIVREHGERLNLLEEGGKY